MTQVRVTSGKERIRPRKSLEESDGYVYTLEYTDPAKPTRYVILWGYKEDLFKPNPSYHFVNQECLDFMDSDAAKKGIKAYHAVEQIHLMDKFPIRRGPSSFTDERLSAEELNAILDYEINWAKGFQQREGVLAPALEIALPRGEVSASTMQPQLANG
jgi:hypothetical protein